MSLFTFLLSGTISVIIWFEVFHSYQLSYKERVAFILTGIIESLLFLASIIGFIGVVARKQLFVMMYTYFLYVHFVLNIVVGIFFLVTVRASNRQELVNSCAEVFTDMSVESSCSRLMSVSTYVFIAIVAALLLIEFYGVLIATRYVYRLRMQKRDDRSRRLGFFHALSSPDPPSKGHTRQWSDNIELLHPRDSSGGDLENAVFDIRRQNSYMPVSMYDRDLPPVPTAASPLSPPSSSDTTSGRRIRALPPRPDTLSPVVTRTPNRPRDGPIWPERLPRNPHQTSMDSEDEQLYATEVSTTAHSALMDHATYMESMFGRPHFPPRSLR
jgi:hypothetical protein